MESTASLVLVAGFVFIVAVLVLGIVIAWRRVMRSGGPLPMFGMLSRLGITPQRVEESVGLETMAHAVRRCAMCDSRPECEQRVAAGMPAPEHCPNAGVFAQARH